MPACVAARSTRTPAMASPLTGVAERLRRELALIAAHSPPEELRAFEEAMLANAFAFADQLDCPAAGDLVEEAPPPSLPERTLEPEDVTDVEAFWASLCRLRRATALLGGVRKLVWHRYSTDVATRLMGWGAHASAQLSGASRSVIEALGEPPSGVQGAVADAHRDVASW